MTSQWEQSSASRIVRGLSGGPALDDAIAAFTGPDAIERGAVVLDSVRPHPRWARYAYLTDRPRWVLETSCDGATTLTDIVTGQVRKHPGPPLAALRDATRMVRLPQADPRGRFVGGWLGYIGYELGSALENVAPPSAGDIPLPHMRWAFYDAVARYDCVDRVWELSALLWDTEDAAVRRLDELAAAIASAPPTAADLNADDEPDSDPLAGAECSFSRESYEAAVARIRDYIAAGDIYQVNLSQRFTWPVGDDPALPGRLFRQLRARHPGWYSAFLTWRDAGHGPMAVCSASPELFLSLAGNRVTTRPIKGTIARAPGGAGDQASIAELLTSEKDAAELAMIVDLERNDLGRVCEFGTVKVTAERQVETHARVHHTVATVTGQLRRDADAIDLLEATFPGGSITGAPKIRAMQIIAELEPTQRSVYTGTVGYLGADGSAGLNIAIRTPIVAAGRVHLQVGGGIVTDSSPAGEYDETIAKAQGLVQSIRAVTAAKSNV